MTKRVFVFFAVAASLSMATAAYAENRASKILTADIAEKVLGEPVEANTQNSVDDTEMNKTWVSKAGYKAKGGMGANMKQALVLIRCANTPDESKNAFDSSKAVFNGTDVSGLGVPAYRTQMPAQLNILKGRSWVIITVGTMREANTSGQEALAKALLPKLAN